MGLFFSQNTTKPLSGLAACRGRSERCTITFLKSFIGRFTVTFSQGSANKHRDRQSLDPTPRQTGLDRQSIIAATGRIVSNETYNGCSASHRGRHAIELVLRHNLIPVIRRSVSSVLCIKRSQSTTGSYISQVTYFQLVFIQPVVCPMLLPEPIAETAVLPPCRKAADVYSANCRVTTNAIILLICEVMWNATG